MRIRSIRPEFWRSPDVVGLSRDHRLLFVGIWSYVDDNGVGPDVLSSIIGDLFPEDMMAEPRETVAMVSEGLERLSERGMISRYSVEGKRYLHVSSWLTHQKVDKPGKQRYPTPDQGIPEPSRPIPEPSRDPRDTLSTGEGEKRRRGEGEKEVPPPAAPRPTTPPKATPYSEAFEQWWKVYPRKESKGDAWKAWEVLRKAKQLPGTRAELFDATAAYARRTAADPTYRKHPAGWLRARKWEDEEPDRPQDTRPERRTFTAEYEED